MIKKLYLLVGAALVVPALVLSTAKAEDSTTQTTPKTTNTTTTSTTTSTEPKTELTAQQKTELASRMEKRKADLKVKITTAEKQRLQNRCKNSQGSLKSLSGRIKGIETSRDQVHENLVTRLTKLSEKLEAKDVDTATLDEQIVALQERITTFKTDLATYKEAVADLGTMECAADPEAFKASLETARAARTKLATDVTGIRKYVAEAIKPTLKDLRTKVAATDKTETEGAE